MMKFTARASALQVIPSGRNAIMTSSLFFFAFIHADVCVINANALFSPDLFSDAFVCADKSVISLPASGPACDMARPSSVFSAIAGVSPAIVMPNELQTR